MKHIFVLNEKAGGHLSQEKLKEELTKIDDTDFIYDKTHAEIAALKKIHPSFNDWQNTEIIVISKKKDGSFRLARPCPICSKAISDLGIKKIYYTNSFGGITKETFIKGDFR